MKINNLASSPSFTRALCQQEESEYKKLVKEALSENHLGIDEVSTTIFDFSMPAGEYNTGIGTSFSKEGIETAKFANIYLGMTSLQLGPQGEVSSLVRSPYSGTTFSLGIQDVSVEKLATDGYENILSKEDLENSPYTTTVKNDETVDYDHVFSKEEGINTILTKAYENFMSLPETSKLKQEFEEFKNNNSYWLERDSIYEALAYEYGIKDCEKWNNRDQNIYADENNIDEQRVEELKKVTNENGDNIVDYNEFVQFILDKQQQETKKDLNKQGISIKGDCHIGFAQKEIWAHKSAFYKNGAHFGCDRDGDGKFITCWTPAPDMDKLDGEAGELFRQKFATLLKRNNAVRIDAAWQLIYPTIVNPTQKDNDGNMRGEFASRQPEIGCKIINILKEEAKKAGVPEDGISLEMLDGAGKGWKSLSNPEVKNAIKDMNCTQTMQYMSNSWGYPGYYRSNNAGVFKHPFEISIGTHDDRTAQALAQSLNDEQIGLMARELKQDKNAFNTTKQKVAGLFAMLFTNNPKSKGDAQGKVSMTITDAVGSSRRINLPNTQDGNWEYRLGKNWQEKYFKNLTENKGLNLAQALSTALKAKEGESDLTRKLDKYADTLRQDGPMTRQEANQMAQEGTLNTIA